MCKNNCTFACKGMVFNHKSFEFILSIFILSVEEKDQIAYNEMGTASFMERLKLYKKFSCGGSIEKSSVRKRSSFLNTQLLVVARGLLDSKHKSLVFQHNY